MRYLSKRTVFILVTIAALLLNSITLVSAATDRFSEEEIIIKFKDGTNLSGMLSKYDLKLSENITKLKSKKVKFKNTKKRDSLIAELKKDPSVAYAQPNYIYKISNIPNDPDYNLQWGLPRIKADKAWDISFGNDDIVIAVADTGVDVNHPDLAASLVYGYNAINNTNNIDDDNGHGTHVAGIAAGIVNNGKGISGVAGKSKIMPIKVMDSSGSGYTSNIGKGIIWAADHGAKVINLSLGSPYYDSYLQDAINYAYEKGALIVAAAGNSNTSVPSYPAALNNVVAVSATDRSNERASFSNYGSYIDIAAPGVSIYSTTYNGAYGYMSGTSMACPFIAGATALVWSLNTDKNQSEIESILKSTAYDIGSIGRDNSFGYGLVDVYNAVQVIEPAPEQTPTPSSTAVRTPSSTPTPYYGSTPTTTSDSSPKPSSDIPSPGTSSTPIPNPSLLPIGNVEKPTNAENISGIYTISGWFLDIDGVSRLEVLVDDEFVGYATYGDLRSDIYSMFPQYENPNCGFQYQLDTTKLTYGSHLLTIRETSLKGNRTPLFPVLFTISDDNIVTPLPSPTPIEEPTSGGINYRLSEDSYVTVTIHDCFDTLVKTLEDNTLKKTGEYLVNWNGKNSAGQMVPDGVYTYKIVAVDLAGLESETITGTIIVERQNPSITAVMDSPDPFDPTDGKTNTISYKVSENALVNVSIYDKNNILVKDLGDKAALMGSNKTSWDGKDSSDQIVGNGTYTYKIKATDAYNKPSETVTGTISIGELDFPVISNFKANPNPFTPNVSNNTTISYSVSKDSLVSVSIYDLLNNPIKILEKSASCSAGAQSILWDGKNSSGLTVSDGNYTVIISAIDKEGLKAEPLAGCITVTGQSNDNETQLITVVSDYPDPLIINSTNTSSISFKLSVNADLNLYVYNSSGAIVKKLYNSTAKSGMNIIKWDGKNDSGEVVDDGIYTYVISARSADGKKQDASGTIRTDSGKPVISADYANPNPFAPSGINSTDISYKLSENCLVSLSIYDSMGELVKTLKNKFHNTAGVNSVSWDGKDSSGTIVSSGSYSYKIDAVDYATQSAEPATGIINISGESIPLIYSVSDLPDPFAPNGNNTCTIFFSLSKDADVSLILYNSNGLPIKELVNDKAYTGQNAVDWNGQNASGTIVDGGTYTYTIEALNKVENISQVYSGTILIDFEAPEISSASFNPNPFTPTGTNNGVLSYSLSEDAYVSISILDSTGTVIKTLEDKTLRNKGANKSPWDGIISSGFIAPDGNYTYRIEAEDSVGLKSDTVTGVILVNGKEPYITDVNDSPDPFAPDGTNSNTISFKLSEKVITKLTIYDITGNIVRNLIDAELPSGLNKIEWDGKDGSGSIVADGTYIYSIEAVDSFGSKLATVKGTIFISTGMPVITIIGVSPNPYKTAGIESENIFFILNTKAKTTIKIFDNNGIPVATLEEDKTRSSGVNQAVWNGKNHSGEVVPDGKYTFKIHAVSFSGVEAQTQSGTIHVVKSDTLVTAIIDSPDPFNPKGSNFNTISFSTLKPCYATLEIFDINGTQVKTLYKGNLKKGEQIFNWDGKDSSGKIVKDGIYTYVLDAVTNSEKESSHLTGTITVGSDELKVDINSISPEPFEPGNNNAASISFTLSKEASVSVSIFDSSNNLVQKIETNSKKLSGLNTCVWDGRDLSGAFAKNGVYTIKITASDESNSSDTTGKITLKQSAPQFTELKDSPDPFSPLTGFNTIEYSITKDAKVSINIYDNANQPVKTIFEGNVTSGTNSSAWDGTNLTESIVPEGTYTYILEAVDLFGNTAYPVKGTITVDMTGAIISETKVSLLPFTPSGDNSITIFYNVSEDTNISLNIYDSSMSLVKTLESDALNKAGGNWITWDGKDYRNRIVNPGTYTYKIEGKDLTGNQSPIVSDIIIVEKFDPVPLTNLITLDDADLQKGGTLSGGLITWNPDYGDISQEVQSNRAWINSKGIDFSGAPNGFVRASKYSGDSGQSTGVCVGYISPNFIEPDYGLSDNEVMSIDLLNGPAESVEVELTTLPQSASSGRLINNQYSTVVVKALDSDNNMVGSKIQTFMGVTNKNLTPVKVKITSGSSNIKKITLETSQFPFTGVWLESIGYRLSGSGNIIITPSPVKPTPAPGVTPTPDNTAPLPTGAVPSIPTAQPADPNSPVPSTPTPDNTEPSNPGVTPTPNDPNTPKTPVPNTLDITQHGINPNPFDPPLQKTAVVTYNLSSSAKVTVAIYDHTDVLVKVLENGASKISGSNTVSWDGKNTSGNMVTSGTYKYLIAAAKSDNSVSTSVTGSFTVNITALTITSVSDAPDLFGANGTRVSTIKFKVSKEANVTIKIYDSGNNLVQTLVNGKMNAGSNSVTWSGKNEKGLIVIDGKYIYKIDAQDSLGNKITQITGTIDLDSTPPRITHHASPIFIN